MISIDTMAIMAIERSVDAHGVYVPNDTFGEGGGDGKQAEVHGNIRVNLEDLFHKPAVINVIADRSNRKQDDNTKPINVLNHIIDFIIWNGMTSNMGHNGGCAYVGKQCSDSNERKMMVAYPVCWFVMRERLTVLSPKSNSTSLMRPSKSLSMLLNTPW